MEIRLNDSDYELLDTGQRVTSQLLKENPNYLLLLDQTIKFLMRLV